MTNVQRILLQPAYIIHQRPYRDTSAIVEVFTESHGRHSLVARGLKRPKSKLKGLLQPFQPLLLSWVSKSELGTLTDAELFSRPVTIKAKYLPGAFYLNELIMHLLQRHDAHDDLFATYHQTLKNLQQLNGEPADELRWQAYLRMFELALLQSTGYGLVLDHDVDSNLPIDTSIRYEYIVDHGPVRDYDKSLQRHAVGISGAALLMLADEKRLLAICQQTDEASRELFRDAKRLLRTVIDFHLGHRTLHSRVLFANIAANEQRSVEESGFAPEAST
jgi:DNA repair protein RecO (recombination protein O)